MKVAGHRTATVYWLQDFYKAIEVFKLPQSRSACLIKGKTTDLGYKEDPSSDLIGFIQLEHDAVKKFHFSVQALNANRAAVDLKKIRLLAKFLSSASDSDQYSQAPVEPLDRKWANNTNEYEYSVANASEMWRAEGDPGKLRASDSYEIFFGRTLSRALTRSSPNLNPEHSVDAFLNAVRLRSRADPIEEYRNVERAAIKSANPPTPSLPHLSQALTQSHLALQAKRNAEEMTAVLAMIERLDIQRKGREEEGMKRTKEINKGIWEGIEGAIRRDEEKKRLEDEKKRQEEHKKRQEEERKKAELKAEEDRKKGEEDRKKKEKEDEDRKRMEKEAKEKEEKDKAEEQARMAAQQNEAREKASKDAQTAQAAQASQTSVKSTSAMQEWENAWTERAALKKLTRAVEKNAELKSVAGRSRRKLRTRVGQVTNSQSELDKLADAIHDIISPSSPHPAPVYTALLSAFSKYLLLQAETEVTAKLPTAYPLARLVWLVIARGHPKLWEIFWARFVGRTGGWGVAVHITRKPGMSDTEWRKLVGRELEGKNDPDDKPPTLETTSQYTDRMVGQLALYAALLQTSPLPGQIQLESVPPPFRLPKLWTWLARVLNSPDLLSSPSAPQCLSSVLEVAGDRLCETYGGQFTKLMKAVGEVVAKGVGGEGETGARVRLGLMVERWEREGKLGLEGRNVER
ncbi:Nucleoporin GLE1 AltName: Full=Nuclear pore protein GLE1 [Rhizoctonia solani AG-1 IB]|uniref:mRNA export factor GLE1 n=1 Tax=Thanatephorus cucumeris (strain AG1-IB / isolate 7/3/14) TaxID=1108050 RepID=M5C4U9_THACB|nr:Nucleoporin GLE1 AltName: Full=Nuclear pore protein GLE1 [Rhizoctonia solani AG-1 IB]